ncbi:hypothetical protein MA16_Dca015200 [Dendrobium catenatum]|uniref:AAA+ ATPase domain-containing protein n=1 Tax=Dendrobium catenatum TaxID=906689 RepID=A0A2I0XAR9_9ASPA|nr:hypothetical protein MA16_Dca015200 [Dendrobium catenatum]
MEEPAPPEALKDSQMITSELNPKPLTIKTSNPASESYVGSISVPISPSISITPHLNSPSPPSSAFVSALQSPYISPRAIEPPKQSIETNTTTTTTNTTPTTVTTNPSPISFSGDDIPSTSYTPTERYDFSEPLEQRPKFSDAAAPRISFSFPAPRVSFTKGAISPCANAKLRSCDVYIGFHGQSLNLVRFCKWLKSELELQGIASFVADRAKYSDSQSHEIADRIICSATYGIVVVTAPSFLNPPSVEEIRFFSQKKNLIPLLFNTELSEISCLVDGRSEVKDCRDAFEGLTTSNEFKLEANDSNWRSCVMKAVAILRLKLARKSIAEKEIETEEIEELPFQRNRYFVGREKELTEIEAAFFGNADPEIECPKPVITNGGGSSEGFADEESDSVRSNGRYICLEMRKHKEPTLEAWIEPVMELSSKGRSLQRQRSKQKKSRSGGKGYGNASVVCISGISGIGKTELALEFAYRYSQRYKMVLWVGGEARYFRQNILNLSTRLSLDVSAEAEKERGRIKSFDEQEFDTFQRVRRELFRDVPFLLIIDNLETEREWWEGKDLHDLIPRNTGATHVIITTQLSRVLNSDPIQLPPLSLADSLVLIRGRRKKDYLAEELEMLKNFDERLGRLSFGLWLIGSLLSELQISPSALFEAIERISLNEISHSLIDDGFLQNNPFLMKTLAFSFAIMERAKGRQSLAFGMILSGAWLAPAPVSSELLAAAAEKRSGFCHWGKSLPSPLCCCLSSQSTKSGVESALMLVKLGLARRATMQPGCYIQFHPITQLFAKKRGGALPAKTAVLGVRKSGITSSNSSHLWASVFLLFGFKSEPPLVQLKVFDMVLFIKKIAIPLAIRSFMTFSRCSSALELLKVSTNVLEEVEKSFEMQIEDWNHGSICWKKRLQSSQRVDEYVWQEVTLLKAALLETRAKLLLRGGHFDSGEELCRTCISIRTVMLGHNHAQTLAAQETLAKLVRYRSKI